MADFDLNPLDFNPLGNPKATQEGIDDSLDHVDTGHLFQAVANLKPIEWPPPQACKDSKIEAALAELALPHLNPDPLSVSSTMGSNICANHASSL
jgi:hypothetical protein